MERNRLWGLLHLPKPASPLSLLSSFLLRYTPQGCRVSLQYLTLCPGAPMPSPVLEGNTCSTHMYILANTHTHFKKSLKGLDIEEISSPEVVYGCLHDSALLLKLMAL